MWQLVIATTTASALHRTLWEDTYLGTLPQEEVDRMYLDQSQAGGVTLIINHHDVEEGWRAL